MHVIHNIGTGLVDTLNNFFSVSDGPFSFLIDLPMSVNLGTHLLELNRLNL